jgi:hypothetical protein
VIARNIMPNDVPERSPGERDFVLGYRSLARLMSDQSRRRMEAEGLNRGRVCEVTLGKGNASDSRSVDRLCGFC